MNEQKCTGACPKGYRNQRIWNAVYCGYCGRVKEKIKEDPNVEPTNARVDGFVRQISGFVTEKAEDGTNLANGLGCTLAGCGNIRYSVNSIYDALAIRLAAKIKQGYATYVIAAVVDSSVYDYNGSQVVKFMFDAGWNKLATMPGAHGSYKTFLMGALTASTRSELMKMWKKERPDVNDGTGEKKALKLSRVQGKPAKAKAKAARK